MAHFVEVYLRDGRIIKLRPDSIESFKVHERDDRHAEVSTTGGWVYDLALSVEDLQRLIDAN